MAMARMKKKDELKLNKALNEAIRGEAEGVDFFAGFDRAKPPIENIYAAEAESEPRVKTARRRKAYYVSFAATAACFALMVVSVALGGGLGQFGVSGNAVGGAASESAGYEMSADTDTPVADSPAAASEESSEDADDSAADGAGRDVETSGSNALSGEAENGAADADSEAKSGDGAVPDTQTSSEAAATAPTEEAQDALTSADSELNAASEVTASDTGAEGAPYKIIAIVAAALFAALLVVTIGFGRKKK
jgi:hypothetical protein